MGNQLASLPWEIDTQDTDPFCEYHVKIGAVTWYGYTDQTHKATLTDQNGNVVCSFDGETDLNAQQQWIGSFVNGLICSDLDSGKLLIYLE